MNRRWWVAAFLVLATAWPQDTGAAPSKKSPRRRKPASTQRFQKPGIPDLVEEQNKHEERLAILQRMRELNDQVKDAELAARLRRLDALERQRHALTLELAHPTTPAPATPSTPGGTP